MISHRSLLAVAVAPLFAGAAIACEVQNAAISDYGGTLSMTVRPGETCTYDVTPADSVSRVSAIVNRANLVILSLRVSGKPSVGRAGVAGRSGLAYVAPANFSGTDRFAAEMTSERGGQRQTSQITVSVQAQR